MICRKCKSENIKIGEHLNYGPIAGEVKHHKVYCQHCGSSYHVEQTQETDRLVAEGGLRPTHSKNYSLHQLNTTTQIRLL